MILSYRQVLLEVLMVLSYQAETVLVKQDCFADLGMEEKENYTPFLKLSLQTKMNFLLKMAG